MCAVHALAHSVSQKSPIYGNWSDTNIIIMKIYARANIKRIYNFSAIILLIADTQQMYELMFKVVSLIRSITK